MKAIHHSAHTMKGVTKKATADTQKTHRRAVSVHTPKTETKSHNQNKKREN